MCHPPCVAARPPPQPSPRGGGRSKQTPKYVSHTSKICVVLLALLAPTLAAAQPYPNRPITLVVPFVAGGSASVAARSVTDRMGEILGQPFVIDNRGGAGSTLGARAVAKSPADGYTILLATNATLGVAPSLYSNVGYDPRKDFSPIGMIGAVPTVLVVLPNSPWRTLADAIKHGKDTGKPIEYGTPGIGTVNHLAAELFGLRAGIKLTHVPYRGAGPALNDLLGGHIPLLLSATPNVHGHILAGSVRALAVTTGKRSALLPEVPTIAEAALPGFDMSLGYGLVAPAGTPRAIIERLNGALNAALATDDVKRRLALEGAEPQPTTPEEHAALIDREETNGAALVKAMGLKPE
jgi:tripartite-type tricarboxylate transporter receptor subunit TctC